MGPDETSPLISLVQDALEAPGSDPTGDESASEQAYAVLAAKEALERPATEDIIERLYSKGHLYSVEGKLRLTDYEEE
ncbi:hypothetical protein V5735_24425 (plasmid) [Haladaptatus sp. SPP-AMP-3]|uniref:hypothetical protein n=1 Tax=Haladaptatus sp. SPP-AMP-3 TaxID=3121295 RepID=UPI003C2DD412